MTQPFGVVHVLVAGETAKHRLPQHADQRVATVLASPRIGEHLTCQRAQSKRVVKFAIGQQSSIGGERQSRETAGSDGGRNRAEVHPIPLHPLGSPSRPPAIPDNLLIAISESRHALRKSARHPANAGCNLFPGNDFPTCQALGARHI